MAKNKCKNSYEQNSGENGCRKEDQEQCKGAKDKSIRNCSSNKRKDSGSDRTTGQGLDCCKDNR